MKKLLLILIFSQLFLFGQAEYLNINHPIYIFFERLYSVGIIKKYDLFHKPITRSQAVKLLIQIEESKTQLDEIDLELLSKYYKEFLFDRNQSTENLSGFFNSGVYNISDGKEKFIYYYTDEDGSSVFVNTIWDFKAIGTNKFNSYNPAVIGNLTGTFRGTFLKNFGFQISGSNGKIFSNKSTALIERDLSLNFKLNESADQTFFDNTSGHLSLDFEKIKVRAGREFIQVGYGINSPILSQHSPKSDHISLNLNLGIFSFQYIHAKLLGNKSYLPDSITGGVHSISEKYFGYHRIGMDISKHFRFGFGEMVVYSNRSVDLSYLNPFSFYKSVEHSGQDRDNSLLFFDAVNNSIPGLFLYSTLLMDDIDYSKLGSGWWGNQILFQLGASSFNLYKIIPLDFHIEFMRIDPYVFTHRLISNNYTNFGYPLGTELKPNSLNISTKLNYRVSKNIQCSFEYNHSTHGANEINSMGDVTKNVGADINLGHRTFDSEKVKFLEGIIQKTYTTSFYVVYEYSRSISISLYTKYTSDYDVLYKKINYWNSNFLFQLTM